MQTTKHMAARMTQRNFTQSMVDAILDTGEWNDRGDQLVMDRRQSHEIDELITEKRRQKKELEQEVRELDRLRRKGRTTVVVCGESLITVYQNTRGV